MTNMKNAYKNFGLSVQGPLVIQPIRFKRLIHSQTRQVTTVFINTLSVAVYTECNKIRRTTRAQIFGGQVLVLPSLFLLLAF